MFPSSTQKHHWIFPDEETILKIRESTNTKFVAKFAKPEMKEQSEMDNYFLTADEEKTLLSFYEFHLKDFCFKFNPPMNKAVIGTAFHYFKRFYLYNSVMNYHPKEILVTCVYLACKIEEFNVSITQFVANIQGNREKATEIILNNELLLMSALKFHLTIHNPYRPVEGFLIDIKTRHPQFDAEVLRPFIDEFLDKVLLTDIPLLYAPSQIALASILEAARKSKVDQLDPYLTQVLIPDVNMLPPVIEAVRSIRKIVRSKVCDPPNREQRKELDKKLENCRNQENNPDSAIYKSRLKRMDDMMDDDEEMSRDFEQFEESFL